MLEYLNAAAKRLPAGVTPTIGPDASGVGWVYQYAVLGKNKSLADLRSLQDWEIRFGLSKAEGIAEVASVGGFVKQYSVVVDPGRLRSLGIPLSKVRDVIRGNNMDVGGRTLELSEHEFMVRGRGYLRGIGDIENIVVKSDAARRCFSRTWPVSCLRATSGAASLSLTAKAKWRAALPCSDPAPMR